MLPHPDQLLCGFGPFGLKEDQPTLRLLNKSNLGPQIGQSCTPGTVHQFSPALLGVAQYLLSSSASYRRSIPKRNALGESEASFGSFLHLRAARASLKEEVVQISGRRLYRLSVLIFHCARLFIEVSKTEHHFRVSRLCKP